MRARKHSTASRQTGDPPGTLPRALRCAPPPLRRAAFLLLLALLIALPAPFLVGCGSAPTSTERAPAQAPPTAEQGTAPAEEAAQPTKPAQAGGLARIPTITATVTEVIDGDTFRARLAGGREERVRLTGVDTPESTKEVEPYGKEAAAYIEKRLSGRTVHLELDVGERDKYGRLLAYVWLSPPQSASQAEARAKMYNAELLLAGMAQVMTVPPNVKYADLFVKLQREAREAGKGLWAAAAPSSGTGATAAPAKYIGNANSKKFHRPDCEWAAKIAPKNRVEFATREAAIAAGYAPCKVCRP